MHPDAAHPDHAHDTSAVSRLEDRITELEMKAAFAEDLLDALNLTVARQQERIDLLLHELQSLREQVGQSGQPGGFRSLRDELPPHY
ncbi:SlyX protein [Aquabacterium fontiphilum]|uniref:SlyX family protein n=1 Tax=Aquabacterium fontiphilum TaxID=450365 RepID=UPI0013770746|nr:SlyX family protein [Aquabacterium fontiphilum]NBD20341.1 SlyX protein [Aquabacterium fontiphilum]